MIFVDSKPSKAQSTGGQHGFSIKEIVNIILSDNSTYKVALTLHFLLKN